MGRKKSAMDPRREATQAAIIEVAEGLFAEFGIDGVSLRQIGTAAGSSNPGVVAYHFGDKAALLDAIFHHRLPGIDRHRGELLAIAEDENSELTAHQLLSALWVPLYEQTNTEGKHSYAGFMGALIRSSWGERRYALNQQYPQTNRIAAKLQDCLPAPQRRRFAERMNMSAIMITGVLQRIDQARQSGELTAKQCDQVFKDGLVMAAAALTA